MNFPSQAFTLGALFFAPLAMGAPAPAPLTLEGALSEATGRNPGLANAEARLEEASWRGLAALSGHIPKFSLSALHLFDIKYQLIPLPTGVSFEAISPKTLVSLSAQWT